MTDQRDRTGLFFTVFLILVALTIGSVVVGSGFLSLSDWSRAVLMIGISLVKVSLVVLFFMHFYWEKSWKYLLTFPAAIMSLFLVMALVPDILYRTHHYSEQRKNHAAESQPASPNEVAKESH